MTEPSLPQEAKKALNDIFFTTIRSVSDSWYELKIKIPLDASKIGPRKVDTFFSSCTDIKVDAAMAINQNRDKAFQIIDSLPENLQAVASAQCADVQEFLNQVDDLWIGVKEVEGKKRDEPIDQMLRVLDRVLGQILGAYKLAEAKAMENFYDYAKS